MAKIYKTTDVQGSDGSCLIDYNSPDENVLLLARFCSKITYSPSVKDDNGVMFRYVTLPRREINLLFYNDDAYTYGNHVLDPSIRKVIGKLINGSLLTEEECKTIGILQSPGWEMFIRWNREPNILLFRKS